jgi:hypothetical protein
VEVDATGIWDESECVIRGEICLSAVEANIAERCVMGRQKSAEGIVAAVHGGEGQNM